MSDFFSEWLKAVEDMLCLGTLGADRDHAREILGRYEPNLRQLRGRINDGEMDLWLLIGRTVEDDIAMFAGQLAQVMGAIRRHNVIRITLVPLVIAAERVRFLAEQGEILISDLPPRRFTPEPARRLN